MAGATSTRYHGYLGKPDETILVEADRDPRDARARNVRNDRSGLSERA